MNSPTESYRYKFSIIMSVYQVEDFIEEAVQSLIDQSIGFEQNVQVVMIDDGSTDRSGKICDRFKEKYPENFVVIHKENGGLSSARNEGLKHVEGRYVNFFDPDDILTPNTLSSVYAFFTKNEEYVDMVAIPMHYFDAKTGDHPTNVGKFENGNRIIDLEKDYTLIHNSVASSFFKNEVAKKLRFDPLLCAMEDAKAILELLIFNPKYGVVSDCKYMYRQRTSGTFSLSRSAKTRKNWYTDFTNRFTLSVINNCLEKLGFIPKFVQAVLLYDLHWKFDIRNIPDGVLTPEEESEFRTLFYSAFDYIDDKLILESKHFLYEHKALILSKKHSKRIESDLKSKAIPFKISDTELNYFADFAITRFEKLRIENEKLLIEAKTFIVRSIASSLEELTPVICINGKELIKCETLNRTTNDLVLNEPSFTPLVFQGFVDLPKKLSQSQKIEISVGVIHEGTYVPFRNFTFSDFCAVSNRYNNQYCVMDSYIIAWRSKSINILPYTKRIRRKLERAFLRELWNSNQLGERKAVFVRLLCGFLKKVKRKKVHIISDRINKADDNGEALLNFYNSNKKLIKKNKIKYFYIIDTGCADYERIKNKHVIQVSGFTHKVHHLLADFIISSHSDDFINKPMYETFDCYRDFLVYQKFVFLQHGITQNDISGWLNRYNKNIFGFVTAAIPESKSILDYDYYYTEKNVWQDGFARFDRLYRDEQRYITLMPTWRKYLMTGSDPRTGIWNLKQGFKESDYFVFYNSLINDQRLLDACKEYGYTLCFMPHPNIIPHIKQFTKHKDVIFFGLNDRYRDIYAKSDMILTDYSSAAFDFAYLRKPLAYMQFDREDFFAGEHVATPGYFDIPRDGFGEVVETLENTVDLIISYMKDSCALKDKYRERIDNFFAYNDKNNCKRIFEHIINSK